MGRRYLWLGVRMSLISFCRSSGVSGKGMLWVLSRLSIVLYVTPAFSAAFQTVIFIVLTWSRASSSLCFWIAVVRSCLMIVDLSRPFWAASLSISFACDFWTLAETVTNSSSTMSVHLFTVY